MNGFESAFLFDSLVWDWIIAIYLFLAGMSAGAVMISIYLKRKVIEGDPANNGIMKAMAWLAPFGIISGLVILIFHLTKPLQFWKIMIYYNPTSVMSMGVVLFQVYMVVLFVWIGVIFRHQIISFGEGKLPSGLLDFVDGFLIKAGKVSNAIELFLGFLAIVLAAYTGFLLSALKTYPMLNNPVLPILFLFSSLSSGAAACLMFGILVFKEPTSSSSVSWVHGFERPVVLFELFVLVTFFTGLIFSGGQNEVAAWNAISNGFWAQWFWVGVVLIGMLMPLTLNWLMPSEVRHKGSYVFVVTTLSLVGVLMLRTFILYAGQMTVV
ncbi:cytochrome c nitrite reductase subunit NrfD [Vibrio parahaemolyticus]|uniref:cytochrome c nitrite reductase subunit NrfD n=1 Tax=Vibrio parahaemolyticus TaxID=670 RepID=UPI00034DF37F|nr:cytochrome c nitrite reductase subunit NrfD [Vibrio parahaemolyticus]EGU0149362.1 cytochrome c nitrite reductase subunit NrfD [Vibrio parahaemolyticus]EJS9607971.1 cytochrome c nitrite reductase subunit NrfD [Vibrio parahaemolyticus]EMA2435632.1 cytochrome c nitrite reductase subunit NrfD [Vibrio parahaemolyticus]MCX8889126.1 cytochrome c nitrite reductase subunit NrfD [Vibrio parahaemolyticus]MDF5405958.1 cytochrome c nitrite reductase subunit NrfD [Vibrio parahaemolyticus]